MDGGMEVVLGVEIEPLGASGAGVLLDGLHESVGEANTAKGRADVEALDLGSMRNLRQRAKHDASGGSRIDRGDPDRRVGSGQIVLEGGAIVAHEHADGFVVFLDEGKGFVGLGLRCALDGDVHDSKDKPGKLYAAKV